MIKGAQCFCQVQESMLLETDKLPVILVKESAIPPLLLMCYIDALLI